MFPRLRLVPFLVKYSFILVLLVVAFSQARVSEASKGRVYHAVDELPHNRVGLLLGTSQYTRAGTPSPFFSARIRAAADLYETGRIDYVLASGDNQHRSYNEPVQMRKALEAAGVPTDAIVKDYAGFRTLDSVVRAKEVFGQEAFTIISQEFHLGRAILIADHYSFDVVGYAADPVGGYHGLRAHAREVLARTLAVLDLHILRTRPRFAGEPVPIPERIDGDHAPH